MDNSQWDGVSGSFLLAYDEEYKVILDAKPNGYFFRDTYYWVEDLIGNFDNEWGSKVPDTSNIKFYAHHPVLEPTGFMRPHRKEIT